MNARPERIKIISKRFTINYVPEGTEDLSEEKMGLCDTLNQTIWIQNDLKEDTQRETLLHEILHAISDEMGLNLAEAQVAGIAIGVLAVLMDNPSFAKFLLKKEKKTKEKI